MKFFVKDYKPLTKIQALIIAEAIRCNFPISFAPDYDSEENRTIISIQEDEGGDV